MATGTYVADSSNNDTLSERLASFASHYLHLRWSFLPVRGAADSTAPKAPAITSWKLYQQHHPTAADITAWYEHQRHQGIAVICGQISSLLVLDFDDTALADQFGQQLPGLTATHTVLSGMRGLPHYYYALPANTILTGFSVPGADLRGEGQYVVAPPTALPGAYWRLVDDRPAYPLSLDEISRIERFLRGSRPVIMQSPQNREKTPNEAIAAISTGQVTISPGTDLQPAALTAYYRQLAPDRGRNNALFASAVLARNHGWDIARVKASLVSLHAAARPARAHPPETRDQRIAEAHRTIESVFTRPASRPARPARINGLPNAVREKLLQAGEVSATAAARLLDALLGQCGWLPGHTFTEREAFEAVQQFGIGRRSVRNALAARIANQPLFTPADAIGEGENADPPPGPPPAAIAAVGCANTPNQCLVGSLTKRVKNQNYAASAAKRGRPARRYLLPSVERLCTLLDVRWLRSDPIPAPDLSSPARYRSALHRELIRARPGQYSRSWLAKRLGISNHTSRRYDRRSGVIVQPVFTQRLLTLRDSRHLPFAPSEDTRGKFLEDADGRRYPALRSVALRLLRANPVIFHREQQPNFYTMPGAKSGMPVIRDQSLMLAKGPIDPLTRSTAPTPDARLGILRQHPHGTPQFVPLEQWAAERADAPTRGPIDPLILMDQRTAVRIDLLLNNSRGQSSPSPDGPAPRPALPPSNYDPSALAPPKPVPRKRRNGDPNFYCALPDCRAEYVAQQAVSLTRDLNPDRTMSQANARRLVVAYGTDAVRETLALLARRRNIRSAAGFIITVLRSRYGVKGIPKAAPGAATESEPAASTGPTPPATAEPVSYANLDRLYQKMRQADDEWYESLRTSKYASFIRVGPDRRASDLPPRTAPPSTDSHAADHPTVEREDDG